MTTTTFTNGVTLTDAGWFNDVNDYVYEKFPDVKSNGAAGDGSTDDASDITTTIGLKTATGGSVLFPAASSSYLVGSTITVPSIVFLVGEGKGSSIKLKNSSNTDIINTTDFATLTGIDNWLVGADGVPYGFGIRNLRIDGNKANQTSGDGVKIYGKGYIIENVVIHDVKGVGFYSECGYSGGQADYRDMPESTIGPLSIYASGSHNFQFRGPHDAHIIELYSSSAAGDGCRIESDGSVYSGTCDIGLIHSYAATLYGFYTNIKIKADHIIGETCTRGGVYIDTAASNSQIGLLECYANDNGDSSTYWNALISAQQCVVSNATILDSNNSAGGIKIDGASNDVAKATIVGTGNTNAGAIGFDVDAASVSIDANIINYTTAGQTGLRTAAGGSRANLDIKAYIENCSIGWNHVTAGNTGRYDIVVSTSNKDHLLFTGAGPATFNPADGAGIRARESWNFYGRNTGTSHSGTAAGGGSGSITLAASAATTDDVYNGCIVTITGGTGNGAVGVVTDYVGSTKVATVSAVNGTTFTTDGTSQYTMSSLTLASDTEGTFTIPSGSTSITIPHGLLITSITPTARNIQITSSNSLGSATRLHVSSVNKYTFTITADANPGATTATGSWKATLTP